MKKLMCLIASLTLAQPALAKGSGWMVEVDPIAYFFKGYSVHVSKELGQTGLVLDLGVFAMDVPDDVEANKDFDTKFDGYGFKLNYTGDQPDGFFAGISGGINNLYATEKVSHEEQQESVGSVGVQAGYRFGNEGFYIQPWIGINYLLNDVTFKINNKEYNQERVQFFPTVHLGYQF